MEWSRIGGFHCHQHGPSIENLDDPRKALSKISQREHQSEMQDHQDKDRQTT
jgi:hypothetical protein